MQLLGPDKVLEGNTAVDAFNAMLRTPCSRENIRQSDTPVLLARRPSGNAGVLCLLPRMPMDESKEGTIGHAEVGTLF